MVDARLFALILSVSPQKLCWFRAIYHQETPDNRIAYRGFLAFDHLLVKDLPMTVAEGIASYPPVIHRQSTILPAITEIGGKLGAKRGVDSNGSANSYQ